MSSLADKLKSLGVQIGPDNLKTPIKSVPLPQLIDAIDGYYETSPSGQCFVVKKDISLGLIHGNTKLSQPGPLDVFEEDPSLPGISSIPFGQFLFIDTETTGLAGGAGTYVFLIGAAKYSNDKFQFAQFFLQDPADEPAQLSALENFASSAKVIISYNGKSFDLPRLKNRFKYHGWPPPFEDVYHLDLLHIARRLWKSHLPSCSLGDIEHHLLGVNRSSLDVPGWQVASLFFDYLQTRDPDPLKAVFYHNEIDVISLISLLKYIAHRLSDPLDINFLLNEDLISIGLYLAQSRHKQSALAVLSHAIKSNNLPEELYLAGTSKLAYLHKKNNDFSQAIPLWEINASMNMVQAHIELAMYYEHKEGDHQEAMHWTLSAVEALSKHSPSQRGDKIRTDLEHRISRLKQKLASTTD